MGRFKKTAQLEKTPFIFVASSDPNIKWKESGFTNEEYIKDRERLTSQLKGDFVSFTLHYPTQKEMLLALGKTGAFFGDDGTIEFIREEGVSKNFTESLAMADVSEQLARFCIDEIDNLEGCPKKIKRDLKTRGIRELKKEFSNENKDYYIPSEILIEIGAYLLAGSQVTETEKKQ